MDPWRIGSLELKSRVVQAPMCGCSEQAFRRVAREHGSELSFTPMLHADALVHSAEVRAMTFPFAAWDHPVGVQLMGTDPGILREAAVHAAEAGADILDVNLGCPVRKIVSKGAGAALLKNPRRVGEIVAALVPAVKIPVTVKMRQGYADSGPWDFLDVARTAQDHGAAAVTIHGRTREQKFAGDADLAAIRKAKETLSIPVIGNGGLWSGGDARRMMRETGCDGVMVARGSLGNPWIYREMDQAIATPDPAASVQPTCMQRLAAWELHGRGMYEQEVEIAASLKLRKISCWYLRDFHAAAALREKAKHLSSRGEFDGLVEEARAAMWNGPPAESAA